MSQVAGMPLLVLMHAPCQLVVQTSPTLLLLRLLGLFDLRLLPHSIANQSPCRHHRTSQHAHHTRACNPPDLHTHAPHRCLGETKHPLDIPRHPTPWDPIYGRPRIPELQEKAQARSGGEADDGGGGLEFGFEGLDAGRWSGRAKIWLANTSMTHRLLGEIRSMQALTYSIIVFQLLVMLPPDSRPLCEFVLRARCIHLLFQLQDFALQVTLPAGIPGGGIAWDFGIESPDLQGPRREMSASPGGKV